MRKYLIIAIAGSLILSFTVSCQNNFKNVVSFIFIDENTTNNANIINELLEIEQEFGHRNHTILFYKENIKDEKISSVFKDFNITQFPGIIIDNKLLKPNQSFRKSLKVAMSKKKKTVNTHISYLLEKNIFTVKYYVCNYNKWSLNNGEVVVYAVEDKNNLNGKFICMLAESGKYNVIAGGCHFPEFVEWKLPAGYDYSSIRFIMVVYDNNGSVLGACCTSEKCSEREKEGQEYEGR